MGLTFTKKTLPGKPALHRAALTPKGETLELIKYLITQGADVNAKDREGNTPLFIAYAVKNDEVVNLINQFRCRYNNKKQYWRNL